MKELSRRDFLKGALAGTAAAALTTVTGVSTPPAPIPPLPRASAVTSRSP